MTTISPLNIPTTTQLSVIELTDLCTLKKVVKEWDKIANNRFDIADKHKSLPTPMCDSDALAQLQASKTIIGYILTQINESLAEKKQCYKVLVCVDKNTKIQAIALVNENINMILDLATHPDNITTPLSAQSLRVRGAATQIILHLAKVALDTGKPIQLTPLDTAEDFYEKLGFWGLGISTLRFLTANKIREYIAEKRPPFDQLLG